MTPAKEKALSALLTHKTKQEAAKAAGIAPRTMTLYLSDPEFQQEYKKAVAQLLDAATKQAQQALSPALSALLDIVLDDKAAEKKCCTNRIAAARSLLEYGMRLSEFNDIYKELMTITGSK